MHHTRVQSGCLEAMTAMLRKPFETVKVLASEPLLVKETRGHRRAFPKEGTTVFQISDSDVPVDSSHSFIFSFHRPLPGISHGLGVVSP